jgi:ABC-2 type transport system ATP-binding protein
MISIKGLVKSFDTVRALDGIDMNVKEGSIYGLVGTNGSGKTTILRLLNGVIKADAGSIEVAGQPIYENEAVKSRMAYIPDNLSFFGSYNLNEVSRYFSDIYPRFDKPLFNEIVDGFGLSRKHRISRFSKGMQKQAVFSLSLASLPDYLILDEPIDGLDPLVRKTIWKYIVDASADRGMTTLVSSHNLREMEGFCDSIGIIDRGHMVLERDLDDLRGTVHKLQISFGTGSSKPDGAYDIFTTLHSYTNGSVDVLIVRNGQETLDEFEAKYRPVLFDTVPLTLEEVFIYELGGEDSEAKGII